MPDYKDNEGESRYTFSSNLKLKLSNFLASGQVKTSMVFDAQRRPRFGEAWHEYTWAEIQPHFGILQAKEGEPPPSVVLDIEPASPPKLEGEPEK